MAPHRVDTAMSAASSISSAAWSSYATAIRASGLVILLMLSLLLASALAGGPPADAHPFPSPLAHPPPTLKGDTQ